MHRLFALLACLLITKGALAQSAPPAGSDRIRHIIVLYLENRSFDNLYGSFPGADGLADAVRAAPQVDDTGTAYTTLPPVPDKRFPPSLPNGPFSLQKYVSTGDRNPDMVHRFYQEQEQIDGGRMDKFVLLSGAGALPMGTFDGSGLPLWAYARRYVLADHFFHGAFGGSFLNHFMLVCACAPRFPDAPADLVASLDRNGRMIRDGAVTPDGFAVNTLEPTAAPHPGGIDAARLLPPQTMPTIGDRLSAKGIDWAWYGGGYADAVAGHPDKLFEYHHNPFLYFANYAEGTAARAAHLKDEADLLRDIDGDKLPAVVFWKPIGEDDEHPGYTDVASGDQHTADIIKRIQDSPAWAGSLIIVTYDENGGTWDHVAPPQGGRWGPGTRVPTIIISPFAKPGYVDRTVYDTTSILRTIETRFDLAPLTDRDAKAAPLWKALQ